MGIAVILLTPGACLSPHRTEHVQIASVNLDLPNDYIGDSFKTERLVRGRAITDGIELIGTTPNFQMVDQVHGGLRAPNCCTLVLLSRAENPKTIVTRTWHILMSSGGRKALTHRDGTHDYFVHLEKADGSWSGKEFLVRFDPDKGYISRCVLDTSYIPRPYCEVYFTYGTIFVKVDFTSSYALEQEGVVGKIVDFLDAHARGI